MNNTFGFVLADTFASNNAVIMVLIRELNDFFIESFWVGDFPLLFLFIMGDREMNTQKSIIL